MTGALLTVVVPTIPGRESLLSRCLFSIQEQAPGTVEIMVVAGPGPLGDKTTLAAESASGEWMTVVDDDDWLHGSYMAEVLPLLDVDFVGFKIAELTNARWTGTSTTTGAHDRFGVHDHGPTPKGVTRRELWRQVRMKNYYTADRDWCRAMYPLVESHRFVDRHLYFYDYRDASSAFVGAGDTIDVGDWPVDWSRITRLEF